MLTEVQIARRHYVVASYVKFQQLSKNIVKDMGRNSFKPLNKVTESKPSVISPTFTRIFATVIVLILTFETKHYVSEATCFCPQASGGGSVGI
jgi:hypothetical protein